ncbi:hypothetical protein QEH42_gp236 [Microbacterium phage Pumpernickel]|uniref:Uncharacterized protein n=1 Tax=Microbacterium phage Pumpernickel TaxID=2885983 RepID=A0AAE8Y7U0_9CAUD|nr:hypothetical protein QEH42_gp236 [Microbacterium phage Pumpernickel]UDL15982.1 hypothetical protein SEA_PUMPERNICKEL_232 [Microbacterium phage Pumpernickel]
MTDTSSNYIEVVHEYEDESNPLLNVKAKEVFWAVHPTPDQYNATLRESGEKVDGINLAGSSKAWSLFGGQGVYVHDIEDIRGLRKLLDSLESMYILDEMTKGGL